MLKPTVLTLCNYYEPGYRGGGPVRTVANLVDALQGEFEFKLLTRDRDLGDAYPYQEIQHGRWQPRRGAMVRYLAPHELGPARILHILRRVPHDVLYLNTVFAAPFGAYPLLMVSSGMVRKPTVIAPRGQFAAAALAKSRIRKRTLLTAARHLNRFRDLTWQASCDHEARDIRQTLGSQTRIVIAPDIPDQRTSIELSHDRSTKHPGSARLAFLSRLHPVKNLDYLIGLLPRVSGRVTLDVYGPAEDHRHAKECERLAAELPGDICVNFRGGIAPPDVVPTLQNYDLFVLPTKGENFCHAVLEALSAGVPVLVSDQTPWRQLEADGCGWDVPLTSPDQFVSAIQSIVDMSESDHAHRRAQAVARAKRFVEASDVVGRTVQMFREAANASGPWAKAA